MSLDESSMFMKIKADSEAAISCFSSACMSHNWRFSNGPHFPIDHSQDKPPFKRPRVPFPNDTVPEP